MNIKNQIVVTVFLSLTCVPAFSSAQSTTAKPAQAKPATAPAKAANQQPDFTQGIDKMFGTA